MKGDNTGLLLAAAIALATSGMATADPNFEEPGVRVLLSIDGEVVGDGYGWVASDLGDVNGDGRSDFVVSAPFLTDADGNFIGKVYVHSGADGSVIRSHTGSAGELVGYSATAVGDVDADGIIDYGYGTFSGARVHSGASGALLHSWSEAGRQFGFDMEGAGDLDRDGHADILIGVHRAPDADGVVRGRVDAYSGADGHLLWSAFGEAAGANLGRGVGPLGDVNFDRVPDVVACAPGAADGVGRGYILSGRDGRRLRTLVPVGLPATRPQLGFGTFGTFHCAGGGDVNGDRVPDVFVGDYAARGELEPPADPAQDTTGTGRAYVYSGLTGHRIRVFHAENAGDGIGPGRIVPDVDRDGRDDVFVAAYTFGVDGVQVGKGYLYSSSGFPFCYLWGPPGCERHGFTLERTLTGAGSNLFLGIDALALGDIDGDRRPELILTGTDAVSGQGRVLVVAGRRH